MSVLAEIQSDADLGLLAWLLIAALLCGAGYCAWRQVWPAMVGLLVVAVFTAVLLL